MVNFGEIEASTSYEAEPTRSKLLEVVVPFGEKFARVRVETGKLRGCLAEKMMDEGLKYSEAIGLANRTHFSFAPMDEWYKGLSLLDQARGERLRRKLGVKPGQTLRGLGFAWAFGALAGIEYKNGSFGFAMNLDIAAMAKFIGEGLSPCLKLPPGVSGEVREAALLQAT